MARKLYQGELEDLVRWFTTHMNQETRTRLMGEMPVHYKLLYPSANQDEIVHRVRLALDRAEAQISPLPEGRSV